MDEITSFDTQKRQTINPMVDEINKQTEPLLKVAMKELGYTVPLYVRVYNQIRFYEEAGKLRGGFSVASKETLAKQFDVSVKQIEAAYNNLTNKYKLGCWVEHSDPIYRNVKRTWVSNVRLKRGLGNYSTGIDEGDNYYSVTPELLQRNSSTITAEQLATDELQGSQIKNKVSESKSITNVIGETPEYGNSDINEMFKYWQVVVGYEISSRRQANRNACNNLIKKHSAEGVRKLIQGVAIASNDKYAPRISDFVTLQSKLNDLILWGKKNQTKQEVF